MANILSPELPHLGAVARSARPAAGLRGPAVTQSGLGGLGLGRLANTDTHEMLAAKSKPVAVVVNAVVV